MSRSRVLLIVSACVVFFAVAYSATTSIEGRYNRLRTQPPYTIPMETAELQQKMFVADLHADSLLWGRNLLRRSTTGHVDLPRLEQAHVSLQAFTVVTTIPRKVNIQRNAGPSDMVRYLAVLEGWPAGTWNSPKQRALYQAARLREFEMNSHGQLVILRTRSDLANIVSARDSHRIAALLGAEGAQPLEGTLDNLNELYAAGFRMMSPTHFTDTEIAGSASGQHRSGLSELGREWVHSMESKGMLIDLAHASPATIRDVCAIATKPVIVSHTGVRGTCDNNRNLSDEELRAIARTGGLVGIGYWDTAVCGHDARSVATAIRYAVTVIGAEHVGLGSDFDGAVTMPFDVTGVPLITAELRKTGFSEHDIRLIEGENVVRVLSQTLPQ